MLHSFAPFCTVLNHFAQFCTILHECSPFAEKTALLCVRKPHTPAQLLRRWSSGGNVHGLRWNNSKTIQTAKFLKLAIKCALRQMYILERSKWMNFAVCENICVCIHLCGWSGLDRFIHVYLYSLPAFFNGGWDMSIVHLYLYLYLYLYLNGQQSLPDFLNGVWDMSICSHPWTGVAQKIVDRDGFFAAHSTFSNFRNIRPKVSPTKRKHLLYIAFEVCGLKKVHL